MNGWEVRFSNSRQIPYFYNTTTNQSMWEAPQELSADQITSLPGAAKYLNPAASAASRNDSNEQVRASHILAKHSGSRRPSSWRQDKITRTLPEARAIIQAHIDKLNALPPQDVAAEFARIASTDSDCSSYRKGGDLGWFGRSMMQESFEHASFALAPGELSKVVETDSGVHVILRTG